MAILALSSRNGKWRVSDYKHRICFEVGVYTLLGCLSAIGLGVYILQGSIP